MTDITPQYCEYEAQLVANLFNNFDENEYNKTELDFDYIINGAVNTDITTTSDNLEEEHDLIEDNLELIEEPIEEEKPIQKPKKTTKKVNIDDLSPEEQLAYFKEERERKSNLRKNRNQKYYEKQKDKKKDYKDVRDLIKDIDYDKLELVKNFIKNLNNNTTTTNNNTNLDFIKSNQDQAIFDYWKQNEFNNTAYRTKTIKKIQAHNKEQTKIKKQENEQKQQEYKRQQLQKEVQIRNEVSKYLNSDVVKNKSINELTTDIESLIIKYNEIKKVKVLDELIKGITPFTVNNINDFTLNKITYDLGINVNKEHLISLYSDLYLISKLNV